jgi:PAS domain S-box-containing protein
VNGDDPFATLLAVLQQQIAAWSHTPTTPDHLLSDLNATVEGLRAQHQALREDYHDLVHRFEEQTTRLHAITERLHTETAARKQREEEVRQAALVCEQRIAERTEALRESEERYRTLVETSPSAILLTDRDSTIHFCNQQAATLFGYPHVDELRGRKGTDLVSPEMSLDPLPYVQMIADSGTVRNMEYLLQRRDGSRFPAEVSSSVITNARGSPVSLIIVVQDISERKQAEEMVRRAYEDLTTLNQRLNQSRNLLQAVFDGLRDGLVLLDRAGVMQMVNQAMARLLGSTPEALVGSRFQIPGSRFQVPGHAPTRRTRYRAPDGSIRILDIQTTVLYTPDQAIEQVIVHVLDVTEHVQLQSRAIENERFTASGRLAASVAHEINTPLQSLDFSLEMAQVAGGTRVPALLTDAREEVQRIARIVRQLLDLYHPRTTAYGLVDMNALLERVLLLAGKWVRDQGVVVACTLLPDSPPVWGHADNLLQVLTNLTLNAVQAMPDGGLLRIQTGVISNLDLAGNAWPVAGTRTMATNLATRGDAHTYRSSDSSDLSGLSGSSGSSRQSLVIEITDTGRGIHPGLQERIFEPFVTTREEGTGLGLSISLQIVKQHNGTLTVRSQLGKGSTFTVMLPLLPPSPTKGEV